MKTIIFGKILSYILIIVVFTVGCTGEKKEINDIRFEYKPDTLSIPIDEYHLSAYLSIPNHTSNNNLYVFNSKVYAIDVIDLHQKQVLKSIKLEKEGPDGIPNVSAFVICDSAIIIESYDRYSFISFDGSIKNRISKTDLELDNHDYSIITKKKIGVSNFKNFSVNCSKNELIVPVYKIREDNYQGCCIASVDMKNSHTELLPIPYPESFKQGKFYGNMDEPQITLKNDSLIYNFPNSSQIFIYNSCTKDIVTHNITSGYTNNATESLSSDAEQAEIIKHYVSSLFFHRICYDKYRNLYYRLHTDKINMNEKPGEKKIYLTVLDENFTKLGEIKLPFNFYQVYNITEQGIVFQLIDSGKNEDFFTVVFLSILR
jgi:hypothetical protein